MASKAKRTSHGHYQCIYCLILESFSSTDDDGIPSHCHLWEGIRTDVACTLVVGHSAEGVEEADHTDQGGGTVAGHSHREGSLHHTAF